MVHLGKHAIVIGEAWVAFWPVARWQIITMK